VRLTLSKLHFQRPPGRRSLPLLPVVLRVAITAPTSRMRPTPWGSISCSRAPPTSKAKQFLSLARTDPLHGAFVLLTPYGLRRAESVGLHWSEVNFETDTFQIRQQLRARSGPARPRPGQDLRCDHDRQSSVARPMSSAVCATAVTRLARQASWSFAIHPQRERLASPQRIPCSRSTLRPGIPAPRQAITAPRSPASMQVARARWVTFQDQVLADQPGQRGAEDLPQISRRTLSTLLCSYYCFPLS